MKVYECEDCGIDINPGDQFFLINHDILCRDCMEDRYMHEGEYPEDVIADREYERVRDQRYYPDL